MNNLELVEKLDMLETEIALVSKKAEITAIISIFSQIAGEPHGDPIKIITKKKEYDWWGRRTLIVKGNSIYRIRSAKSKKAVKALLNKNEGQKRVLTDSILETLPIQMEITEKYCDIEDVLCIRLGSVLYTWIDNSVGDD
jgi:hypothetical protein